MYRRNNATVIPAFTLLLGAALMLSSCGGGGGGGVSGTQGTISGTAVKGPVNGATVRAFAIDNGTMGTQVGSSTTDGQGDFTLSIGSYSGPVLLIMSGGTYTDEATGTGMTMHSGDVMTCATPSVTAGATMSGIQITPLTSMAQARAQNMAGGMVEANIAAANTAVGDYFMVHDILHTQPINPLIAASGTAAGTTQDMKNYGMAIAAMSQYASTLGMSYSSGVITAMMDDASDGVMDGMMAGTPISMSGMGGMMGGTTMMSSAGTSALATAMSTFINNGAVNRSGLSVMDMNALITKLSGSHGMIQ